MIIMIRVISVILILGALWLLYSRSPQLICKIPESFDNPESPFPPLGMNKCRQLPDSMGCMDVTTALQTEGSRPFLTGVDVPPAGPIVSLNCNKVPLATPQEDPLQTYADEPYPVADGRTVYPPWGNKENGGFEQLTETSGKYMFEIPELLYDGIWKKDQKEWVLPIPSSCAVKGTYGADKLSPMEEKCMFGKTIIDPPECDGLVYPSAPPRTYIYDC